MGIQPCTDEQTYIFLCCPTSDVAGCTQETDRGPWLECFPELADFIERIPDGGRWGSFTDVVSKYWSRGKVALLGDAAHAMAPNLGQNGCLGMHNAVALVEALEGSSDVASVLPRWESEQRYVTDVTQRYSNRYGVIGTRWPAGLQDVRSAIVWSAFRTGSLRKRFNVAARSPRTVSLGGGHEALASARP
jgi:2-polyprenyl-6-methoxyphenol hydroxylase-like FAD-dependent oxidoreductase